MTPNEKCEAYIFHCCLYYVFHTNLLSDENFDNLAFSLYDDKDKVDCEHKHLINFEFLEYSSSGFYLAYPLIVRFMASNIAHKRYDPAPWMLQSP